MRLPRQEVEDVDQLRDHWQELLNLAEEVRRVLLKEKRANFEQELDKQVSLFILFSNLIFENSCQGVHIGLLQVKLLTFFLSFCAIIA